MAGLAAALLAMMPDPAPAQVPASQSPAEICLAANLRINLGAPLPRTAARLRAGELLRIVAVGSSSTTGLWVLQRSATYPEVMGRELAVLRPAARVEMINSGRVGDTVAGSMARFERDVIAYRPDLVVWQLGTNDVAWGGSADGLKDQIVNGVRQPVLNNLSSTSLDDVINVRVSKILHQSPAPVAELSNAGFRIVLRRFYNLCVRCLSRGGGG